MKDRCTSSSRFITAVDHDAFLKRRNHSINYKELIFDFSMVIQEFEGANWDHDFGKEAEDGQLWQDDWDDDDTNDDFTQQLRQQIESTAAAASTAPMA